jgi:hypothetical protein
MPYELEDIKTSQEIFYFLLEHHQLSREDASSYFDRLSASEELGSLVRSQAESAHCKFERYGSVYYLIPDEDNKFLGYSKAQLKKELCKSGATDKDYYLVQFVILTLLLEFYDGQGTSSKTRDYIRLGELQNSISDRLKEGRDRMEENEQNDQPLAFAHMLQSYEALRSDDRRRRQKTTKEGFLYTILHFLQEQDLIDYIEEDEMILTTPKLDHFMDWNLLNKNNYRRVMAAMGAESGEAEHV